MRTSAPIAIEFEEQACFMDAHPVLVVPGWNGSDPGHWQTIWQEEHPNFQRVEQANWTYPAKEEWVCRLRNNIRAMDRPGILVAHSLGCLAVAHWAAKAMQQEAKTIVGAFLVAPPWLSESELSESERCPAELRDFLPMPLAPLPFPAMLVASENDPYLPIANAVAVAASWEAQFVNVGRQGHINIASGHGPWERGEALLSALIARAME